MNKLYLKEPKNGHNDITCPVTILNEANTHGGYEYIVYSGITDKTFSVKEDEVKSTPVDSEYVVDTKTNKEKFLALVDPIQDTSVMADVKARIMKRHKRFYAACAAMQGILSNSSLTLQTAKSVCEDAYKFADELILQEHEQMEDKI